MTHSPRHSSEALLSGQHIFRSLAFGGLTTVIIFGMYAWVLSQGLAAATAATAAFVTLVTANAALILPSRSSQAQWKRLWQKLTPTSLWVLGLTLLAMAAITSIETLAQPFRFAPLSAEGWLGSFLLGLLMLPAFQMIKKISLSFSDR